jgi:hypothetical protein
MKNAEQKSWHNQLLVADGDLHVGLSNHPFDQEAWRESLRTVALADRRWLRKHRNAEFRRRPITPVELRMTGHPPGTEVCVYRGPDGSQVRCFLLPVRRGAPPSTAQKRDESPEARRAAGR